MSPWYDYVCIAVCTGVLGSVRFRQANDSNMGVKIVSASANLEAARPCYSISRYSDIRCNAALPMHDRDHHKWEAIGSVTCP